MFENIIFFQIFIGVNGMTSKITIIGAGAAGISAALELAERGYKVLLIERNTMGDGASGRNPGRMGHGFHYADVDTALSYLRASIKVQRKYPGFLIAEQIQDSPLRRGRYFITKDSNPNKDDILRTYEQIKAEYARLVLEDPANEVFGRPDDFYHILSPEAYQHCVNMDLVEMAIETNEHLFLWHDFKNHMKQLISSHPNIELLEHTNVCGLKRNSFGKTRFIVEIENNQGGFEGLLTDYIINSTWENIEYLNSQLGIQMPSRKRTNRLKTLLIVELPEALKEEHSMFFCMGQHCMMSNMGDGRAMMTFAKVTNIETCSDLKLSVNAERLLSNRATPEEIQFYGEQIIKGVSHYIPKMIDAKVEELKFGIVQTLGALTLEQLQDANHQFHKRSDHNIRSEQLGLISNPCMKLFYFLDNAEIVTQLIEQHIAATKKIDEVIDAIQQKLKDFELVFSTFYERHLRSKLEQIDHVKIIHMSHQSLCDLLLKPLNKNDNFKQKAMFFSHDEICNKGEVIGFKI